MTTNHEYKLAEIFQSGILFQRDKEVHLWGSAALGTVVSVSLYKETDETADGTDAVPLRYGETFADQNGQFFVALPPVQAGEGFYLDVLFRGAAEKSIRLEHVGFGDIWLAGGQSNMEFFLKYDRDWEETKKLPHNPQIRMYNVPQRAFDGHTTHNKTGYGYWFDDSDPALACSSAPGYSFARHVQEATGVPIGIIGCNWGGSTASTWVSEEVLRTPPLDAYLREYEDAVTGLSPEKLKAASLAAWEFEDSTAHYADFEPLLYGRDRAWQLDYMKAHADDPVIPMGPYNFNRPAGLYHTMLSKLIPFSIKGVIWYQGESDAGDKAFMYDKLLTSLVESWRKEWNDNFPFLIVQLAPFGVWLDCDSEDYTTVREKQAAVAEAVPGVYMASIMDLGSYYDIHPKEKMEVGRRLALLARGHVYGEKELLCDAPEAVSAVFEGHRKIVITFRHADGLTMGEKESDWNIQIQNQDIQPSEISIKDDRVILTLPKDISADISNDQALIYISLGYKDYAEIHIRNRAGLSALPFQMKVV